MRTWDAVMGYGRLNFSRRLLIHSVKRFQWRKIASISRKGNSMETLPSIVSEARALKIADNPAYEKASGMLRAIKQTLAAIQIFPSPSKIGDQ
jgi:uncharacterized NAD(P)/FAD-binding protein YdhS